MSILIYVLTAVSILTATAVVVQLVEISNAKNKKARYALRTKLYDAMRISFCIKRGLV